MASVSKVAMTFDRNPVELTLGDVPHSVFHALSNYPLKHDDDPEIGTVYLRIIDRGVELVFNDTGLSTIFVYLTAGPEDCGVFCGEFDFLSKSVRSSMDDDAFCRTMEAQGFRRAKKTYPSAIDFLNEHLRVRLECRGDKRMVVIDDGAMIRSLGVAVQRRSNPPCHTPRLPLYALQLTQVRDPRAFFR